MANHTNYTLRQVDDSTYADGDWTLKLGHLLSAVLGNFLMEVGLGGVISGWTLNSDKTVAAGSGLVNGTMPKTTSAQAITGLTNGVVNYVYATTDTTSHEDGRTVDFVASTSATNPAGTVRLGSMTLSAGGVVTASSDNPDAYLRDYLIPSRRRKLTFTETYVVAVGTEAVYPIDHSAVVTFTGQTWFRVTDQDPGVHVRCQDTGGGTFDLHIWNDWRAGYDYDYYSYDPTYVSVTVERVGEV